MPRIRILLPTVCFVLLIALAWCPHPSDQADSVMSPRLTEALDGGGPWVVWVFFKDKGVSGDVLDTALDQAENDLSPRAARRRAKVASPEGRLVDEADLAVHPEYLARALSTGATPRQISR